MLAKTNMIVSCSGGLFQYKQNHV